MNLDENLTLFRRWQRCGLQAEVACLRYAAGAAFQNHLCDIGHFLLSLFQLCLTEERFGESHRTGRRSLHVLLAGHIRVELLVDQTRCCTSALHSETE